MSRVRLGVVLAAGAVAIGAGAVAWAQSAVREVREIRPGLLAGYLPKGATPDSLAIIPPAPDPHSPTQARDDAAAKAAQAFRGSPRWTLATQDADLTFPAAADDYACAVGVRIGAETTPRLYQLLRRTLTDAGLSTYPTKTKFQRPRPFMVAGGSTCTPQDEKMLRGDGSYPSGHSAVGWAWALILAEAAPDRATQILARGRGFMQSRVVCNVHWQSDIEAGATMGAAVVARLHDEPDFRAYLEAARSEIAAARTAGQAPQRDCAAEASAAASAPLLQP